MLHSGNPRKGWLSIEQWLDPCCIAKKQKFNVRPFAQRPGGSGNDDLWPMVTAHGVERDTYRLRHQLSHSGIALEDQG